MLECPARSKICAQRFYPFIRFLRGLRGGRPSQSTVHNETPTLSVQIAGRARSRIYRCLFFRFLLDRSSVFDGLSLGTSPVSSKGRFVPEVGVPAELVVASSRAGGGGGGGGGCDCVPGITSLGSDNIARWVFRVSS